MYRFHLFPFNRPRSLDNRGVCSLRWNETGQNHAGLFVPQKVVRKMTLEAYNPDQIDRITLRTLDVCCRLRNMAQRSREEQLRTFPLHDKKALEWLAKLEEWVHKAEADLNLAIYKQRGARQAAEVVSSRKKR